ncbi:MAG: hypothetical protein K0S35_3505, partial [Geminicoccaceae bacterium]|nr:hypothetical protein [Geminicoccaceae bacterium]
VLGAVTLAIWAWVIVAWAVRAWRGRNAQLGAETAG